MRNRHRPPKATDVAFLLLIIQLIIVTAVSVGAEYGVSAGLTTLGILLALIGLRMAMGVWVSGKPLTEHIQDAKAAARRADTTRDMLQRQEKKIALLEWQNAELKMRLARKDER